MRTALSALLLVLVIAPLPGAPAPKKKVNLLTNGSFEQGPVLGTWLALNPGSKEITGWVVTRGQIDLVGSHWAAAEGKRSIDLHGSPGFGGVSQTFATTAGKTYVVTFMLAGNPDGSVPKKTMGASAAGKSATFTFDAAGKTHKAPGWKKQSWRFTAKAKKTTLELYTLMKNDDACGPILDDVSVVED